MLRKLVTSSVITAQSSIVAVQRFNVFQRRLFATETMKESDGVKCSIFDHKNKNIARSVLVECFANGHEPMCYHIAPRHFEFCVEPYLDQAEMDKLSIVAEVDGKCAGVAINNDFTFIESDQFIEDLKKRDYLGFDMIFEMERELNKEFRHDLHAKGFKPGVVMRMLLVAVNPFYHHKGLANHLVEESVERAKHMDYKYVSLAATNDHIKMAAEKYGFECINELNYDDWEYPKGTKMHPKKGISELTGFRTMSMMVKKL